MKRTYPKGLKMIPCIKCNEKMPELRLIKFGYKVCVDCSTMGAYKAVSTTNGRGDHTWNDIQIMSPEQAEKANAAINRKAKWDKFED